ncbi:Ig-like domain-containing protein [Parasphingorhabdus sp. DH2-15]|uniref:Ig-like domain-containing protein n=1 Tax=Parasphingorhabdus sp. DH2-15 TaxID=3444112 RepID=UPI003F68778F
MQSGQLRIFDPLLSSYVDIGPDNSNYNAIGFNVRDGLIYGMFNTDVIRVDANGILTTLFSVSFSSLSGDVDNNNNLWVNTDNNLLQVINLATQSVSTVTMSQNRPGGAADMAFVDTSIGSRIIMVGRTQMALIDPVTGATTSANVADLPNEGTTGAIWSDGAGRVLLFKNTTGNVYELFDFLTSNPRAELVATGVPSGNNDGTSCSTAPFPNLPPIAFNDDFRTPFNTAITANVITNNGNGMDNDPEDSAITVATSPVNDVQNGSLTLAADGSFTYTPDNGFFGTDSFTYRITDASGLSDTATVTIIVERAIITVEKSSIVYQPTAQFGYALPQNEVIYAIVVRNTGTGPTDSDSLLIVDRMPAKLAFWNDDIDAGGSDDFSGNNPIGIIDNGSGLDFDFTRDVRFSDAVNPPSSFADCNYAPQSGFDPAVRYICFNPKGNMNAGGSSTEFILHFRARIE